MSQVNADGVLIDPQKHLLQETQALTNALLAPEPEHQDESEVRSHPVYAANGQLAGTVGGIPHMTADSALRAGRHRGAGTAMSSVPDAPVPPQAPGGRKKAPN